ncbi:MAG: hypothetical protein R3E82_13400 [Pseudomonadales bacterium]|nr:hypothetical protein [Pseudomonadales bacterium]
MSRLWLAIALLVSLPVQGLASDCVLLNPDSDAYGLAKRSMSGHLPVDLTEIEDCGVAGYSRLFKATVDVFENHEGWARSGSIRCWQHSRTRAGDPYHCGRTILNSNDSLGVRLVSRHDIPLPVVADAAVAMIQKLAGEDELTWMDYVPVDCGGAWSIDGHGFLMKLKSREPGSRRQFLAKKNCSPTPCQWDIEEIDPETWVN